MKAIKRSFTIILILSLGFGLSIVAIRSSAAPEQTGKIAGMVLDEHQARIVNAGIAVTNGQSTYRTNTDDTGEFALNVPPGDYRMKVSADGFRAFSVAPFSITVDNTLTFKINLRVAEPRGLVPAAVR
jgi:hypothetical protein